MIVYQDKKFPKGYTPITELDGVHKSMLMDFGIQKISAGEHITSQEQKERAFLLMAGEVEFTCEQQTYNAHRNSLLEEEPYVLHVPSDVTVNITAHTDVELCVQKVNNDIAFPVMFFTPDTVRSQRFGEGTMQNTSTRTVRTIFDASNAPQSNMVLGEAINYPGKWSSYPPHHHPQPEVYHYRFFPENGFGFGEVGDSVYKLKDKSTLIIPPRVVHPQTSAPGYVMYYIWMIPHLFNAKFGPDSREFVDEHAWLLDPKAVIWPDKKI